LTYIEKYNFFELDKRGGIFMIANRYSKANNKYFKNYNPNEENTILCIRMLIIYIVGL
jgi:hypothetical protein